MISRGLFFTIVKKDQKLYENYVEAMFATRIKHDAHFLAQLKYESLNFTKTIESNKYSANSLLRVFGKYFNSIEHAKEYERSDRIFDRVYANRMGNGDEASKDGSRYKGRGFIQLTGRNNYRKYGYEGIPNEVLEDNFYVSALFYKDNGCDSLTDVKKITRIINGGYNGLSKRIKLTLEIQRLIGSV